MTQSVYGQHQDAGVGIIMGIITQYILDGQEGNQGRKEIRNQAQVYAHIMLGLFPLDHPPLPSRPSPSIPTHTIFYVGIDFKVILFYVRHPPHLVDYY